ncbi:MAG: DNA gyrase subunit A [Blastocatellia bacterium]|nr:DNA gyrase subunit A [Blastocatellia bacterium]
MDELKLIPANIEDEMKRSYLDYAMSVIIGRALPDVRDGFKPVHRRVLWAMHELGNAHNKPYKKSARVVGDCFVAGTLVHTTKGLCPIEQIEVGEEVLLPNGYTSRVVEAYQNPPSPVIEVNLSNGKTLKVTHGQLFRVLHEDLTVTWVRADQLEGKQILVSSPRTLGTPLPHSDPSLVASAYVAGLLVAEGYLTDRGRSNRVGINMVDKEPLEFVQAYCSTQAVSTSFKIRQPQQPHYLPQYQLRFSGLSQATEICTDTCAFKQVPEHILGDRSLYAPFLAGFVDGDGFLRAEDSRREAVLASTSKLLLAQIQTMLADCGIHSALTCLNHTEEDRKRGHLPRFALVVTGENASLLSHLIAAHLRVEKKVKAAHSLAQSALRQATTTPDCIPGTAIFAELSRFHVGGGWYQDQNGKKFRAGIKYPNGTKIRYSSDLNAKHLSFRQIEAWGILEKLERIGSSLAAKLKYLINNYCVLEVVSVLDCGETAENFDIQIADPEHEFLVEGCAVHNCIGKFHPHGDSAVYDTMVRMVQDFSMRVPMIDGQGNFGSVDGDAPAAMRYCIENKGLIITEKGLQEIGSLSPEGSEDVSLQVLSHGGKVNTASKWFDSGEHQTYRIRTRHGYEITGTANHPLMVMSADTTGRPAFGWKLLADMKPGDVAVLDRSETLWPTEAVNLKPFHPEIPEGSRREKHDLPSVLTEDLAFLLGALTAEGTVREQVIEFTNTFGEFADTFIETWKRVFPTCRLHLFERQPTSYGKKPFWQMQVVSRQVITFLNNLGLNGKSSERTISQLILQSPQPVAAAFLRGFYEGDGAVERSGRSCLRVTMCSNSAEMLRQLQILLLRFGIVSSRYADGGHGRNTHRLCILGQENLKRFAERIDFHSQTKKKALQQILALQTGKALSKHDYIPMLATYVRRTAVQQHDWLTRNNFDRPPRLQKALPRLAAAISLTDYLYVEMLSRLNYLYDPVVAIEDAGVQPVYSVRVDSECHSFVANGFINHNTECRLSRAAEALLADIEKETVDFQPNYDESQVEPIVLPARFPNLLVNGSAGIAVGMATNIPPHNLAEVVDASILLIQKPQSTVEELMKFVQGPDFPTAGFICGRKGILQAYLTGRGSVTMRARAAVDYVGKNGGERQAIVVTELPYQVNKARLIEKIAELINDKKLEDISDLRDESDRDGMRIVIELKRSAIAQVVLNNLYKQTQMQLNFGIINLAIVNGQPKVLGLVETLQHFIDHRKEVVRRRTLYELRKAEARAHILEGLKKALDLMDAVIGLIRAAKSPREAREGLVEKFQFTEIQAQAILDMQLQKLTGLERQKILEEYEAIIKKIAELNEILANETVLKSVIIKELQEVKKEFGDERRTIIRDEETELTIEDLIPDEDNVITITHGGYIKRTPLSSYRTQRRGGVGRRGMGTKAEDVLDALFIASAHAFMMIFTDKGQVYKVKVHEIPDSATSGRGKAIVNLVELPQGEKVAGMFPVREFGEGKYVVMVTRKGIIKKTELSEYANIRSNGIIAMGIDEGDELIAIQMSDGAKNILISTYSGMAIQFKETDVRPMGRSAYGVIGINLRDNDYVTGFCVVDGSEHVLCISELGLGKRTLVSEYPAQSRGGVGVINMRVTERTGGVINVLPVKNDNQLMVITQQGQVVRVDVEPIRETSRAAQGVKIINLSEGDKVVSSSLIDAQTEPAPEGALQ